MQTQSAHPAFSAAPIPSIAPAIWEVVALLGGSVFLALLLFSGMHSAANLGGPIALAAIVATANWKMVRAAPEAIWTPLFSFRLGVLVFLALGALVPYFVGDALVDRIRNLYAYSPAEAAKANLVWFVYSTVVIASAKLCSLARSETKPIKLGDQLEGWSTARLGIWFFAGGFGYSVLVEIPRLLEWFSFVIPGSLSLIFLAASSVGTFLITYNALQRGGAWYLGIVFVLGAQVVLGLILYNKSMILLPILLSGLAVLLGRVTVPRVLAVTGALLLALNLLQPAVAQGREMHYQAFGSPSGGTIAERLEFITSYWTQGPLRDSERGEGLIRLSYLNIATFMVAEFDMGLAGNSIESAGYALIPRFIWPDKPTVTDVGRELNYYVTGDDTSYIAPTTAADLYWNLGWVGLLVIGPILGMFLWAGTVASYSIIKAQDWFMMPYVLVAFLVGLGTDQGFVVGILVPSVAAAIAFFTLRFAKVFVAIRGDAAGARGGRRSRLEVGR